MSASGPHAGQPVAGAGEPLELAGAAMVMLHGRGAGAGDILSLTADLNEPGWSFLAPQAAGGSWYPLPFTSPLEANEPWLSSALEVVTRLLARSAAAGIPPERTVLLGFSQGACLALESAARQPRRYGGVVGLSGGLIGPDGLARPSSGSLAGTPVFLGCSDHDPYIPSRRVTHAAEVLRGLGADVTMVLYPDLDHSVNEAELEQVREIMRRLAAGAGAASQRGGASTRQGESP
jgi:predicted esterase